MLSLNGTSLLSDFLYKAWKRREGRERRGERDGGNGGRERRGRGEKAKAARF